MIEIVRMVFVRVSDEKSELGKWHCAKLSAFINFNLGVEEMEEAKAADTDE